MRDDEGARCAGEVGGEILGELLGEVILVRVAALVRERQDDERQPGAHGRLAELGRPLGSGEVRPGDGQSCRARGQHRRGAERRPEGCPGPADLDGARRPPVRRGHGIDPQGSRDVLQPLRAEIEEPDLGKAAHLEIGGFREPQRAGIGGGLQARGDVDAVSEDIPAMDHDVAEMDPDAQAEPPGIALGLGERLLDRDGAADGVRHGGELGQHAVPGRVRDPPAPRQDEAVDDLPHGLERPHGAALVGMHSLGIAGDVGGEDRGQPAFRNRPFHGARPFGVLAHCDPFATRPPGMLFAPKTVSNAAAQVLTLDGRESQRPSLLFGLMGIFNNRIAYRGRIAAPGRPAGRARLTPRAATAAAAPGPAAPAGLPGGSAPAAPAGRRCRW